MQIWSAEIKELGSVFTSIKGRFPELDKELEQLIETRDANVVMLYSRRYDTPSSLPISVSVLFVILYCSVEVLPITRKSSILER